MQEPCRSYDQRYQPDSKRRYDDLPNSLSTTTFVYRFLYSSSCHPTFTVVGASSYGHSDCCHNGFYDGS